MGIYKWRAQEEHLLKLLLPTNSVREISEQINRRADMKLPGFPCHRGIDAVRRKINRDSMNTQAEEYTEDSNPVTDRMKQIEKIQEQYKDAALTINTGLMAPEAATRKILSISDIHFPLARLDLLEAIIHEHSDANICVVNGDLLEGYIFSTFGKSKRIAALHEYNAAFEFLDTIRLIFPDVVIVGGNHDNPRVSRALARAGMTREATQILRPDLLARLANGERLDQTGLLVEKKDFSNVHYQQSESWYVKIGKAIFAHPHGRGSAKAGWTVQHVQEYFSTRYGAGEVDCICIGHTHKLYKGVHKQMLLMEQGCLAGLMTYAHKPKLEFIGNGVNGYAVVHQDAEGNTDWNRSTPIYMGMVLPPKKAAL